MRQRGQRAVAPPPLAELARLRQATYRLFGALFLYPDQERLTILTEAAGVLQDQSASLAVFPFLGPWQRLLAALQDFSPSTQKGTRPGAAAEMERAYARLFLVNPQAPPYESCYLDPQRQATGLIEAQLAREYGARGLILSPSCQEPPDHAAVELEFMAFLCNLEAQAWQEENPAAGAQALAWQRAFLGHHLARWFPAFARQVAVADPQSLYAVAARAVGAFIHHDRDLVALLSEGAPAIDADSVRKGRM